jgi:iron complex transport system substrate-binding protein
MYRAVSLLPSATETVCALGARECLVGISHECDHPPEVSGLPVLTASRISAEGSSREIDARVREALVSDALSIYTVDVEKLGTLSPDVILTQDLCDVCAVSLDDVRAAVARMAHLTDVRVVSLRPTRLLDIFEDVTRVGKALSLPQEAACLRACLESRLRWIAEKSSAAAWRPRVASVEWIEPLMLGGTWMPELIEIAGGSPVGVTAGHPAPTLVPGQLRELAPDVVVIKPCGFPLGRALQESEAISRGILAELNADARVYVTDGNAFFNRPGPRIVESVEILAACAHPGVFPDFGEKHRAVIHPLR